MSNITKLPTHNSALAIQAMRDHRADLMAENGALPRVDENTKLVPLNACRAIVEKIDDEYQPAGEGEHTTNAVAFLLGGYPQSSKSAEGMENPKIYMAHVVRVFAKYPATLHTKATNEILDRHKFKPAIAEITQVFEELVGKWTYAQIIARKHIREHERRQKEAEREAVLAKDRKTRDEHITEMREKYGDASVGYAEKIQGKGGPRKVKEEDAVDLQSFGHDRAELDRKAAELLSGISR